jgi:hypothetical protein
MNKPQVKRYLIIKGIDKEDRTIDVCATGLMLSYIVRYCTIVHDAPLPAGVTLRFRVEETFDFDEVYDHLLELEFDNNAAAEIATEMEEYRRRMAEQALRDSGNRSGWMRRDDDGHP